PEPRKQLGQARAYRPEDAFRIAFDRMNRRAADQQQTWKEQLSVSAWAWLLLGLVALGGGGWLGYQNAELILRGHASLSWPTAPGKVVQTVVREQVSRTTNQVESRSVTIRYAFVAGGTRHTSENLWFGWQQQHDS